MSGLKINSGVAVLLLVSSLACDAQKIVAGANPVREYIFKKAADSILYFRIDSAITGKGPTRWANAAAIKEFDSLLRRRSELAETSIGARYIYKPRYRRWDRLDPSERKNVTQLTLYNWKSSNLPDEILECTNLEKLEIINSSIGLVGEQINALPKLVAIEFYNNRPAKPLRFEKNVTLHVVVIRANSPEKLPRSFRNLEAIERIDLSRTGSTSIPKVYKNKKLKELILADNAIKVIRLGWLRKHKNLERLDLRINKIKYVPGSIANFPSLKVLLLNVNQVATVSRKIGKLSGLEDVSFYMNNLTAIPPALYRLKMLKKLDLYYNRIDRLDSSINRLNDLSILGLDNNNITSLPANLGKMSNLKEIYLNNNRLTSLPESLSMLTSMKVIQFSHNYLTEFPSQILHLTKLTNLDISNNMISSLPERLFDFKNFEILSLYGNPYDPASEEKLPALIEKLQANKTFVLYAAPAGN